MKYSRKNLKLTSSKSGIGKTEAAITNWVIQGLNIYDLINCNVNI